MAPSQRLELGPLAKQAHLLNRDLAQRAVRREGDEIRMRREEQRIVARVCRRSTFRARSIASMVGGKAQIVVLDFVGSPSSRGGKAPRQSGFAYAFRPAEQNRLRDSLRRRSSAQAFGRPGRCRRSSGNAHRHAQSIVTRTHCVKTSERLRPDALAPPCPGLACPSTMRKRCGSSCAILSVALADPPVKLQRLLVESILALPVRIPLSCGCGRAPVLPRRSTRRRSSDRALDVPDAR